MVIIKVSNDVFRLYRVQRSLLSIGTQFKKLFDLHIKRTIRIQKTMFDSVMYNSLPFELKRVSSLISFRRKAASTYCKLGSYIFLKISI